MIWLSRGGKVEGAMDNRDLTLLQEKFLSCLS
jgi:hypothetical protein